MQFTHFVLGVERCAKAASTLFSYYKTDPLFGYKPRTRIVLFYLLNVVFCLFIMLSFEYCVYRPGMMLQIRISLLCFSTYDN